MALFDQKIHRRRLDSKAIHRALFGAFYEEDVYDKFCGLAPQAMRLFQWRIPEEMRQRNLIFVHVPRVAGTSIARALYGARCTRHHSIRYYKTVAPDFWAKADSFAVLRDPFDRVASAYAFVRTGGTPICRLSEVFVRQTAHLRSMDDYLSFVEERDDLSLDFVMRPQSWFVSDLATGELLVKRLFLYGRDDEALGAYLKGHGVEKLGWLNPSIRNPLDLSSSQKRRIEKIYARDFELVEALRGWRAGGALRLASIAAE
ncbi:MAG TPA: sulfotransferase family 2 domain-containing protein [Rhizomicrobium sp.]|jgi:hypothetical protein